MAALREAYAASSISAVARLLTLLDRNPVSPTYGCFHRDYWFYKTSDFSDAVRQFGVHALALVYKHDFPDNPYKGSEKIRDWTVAAMDFWARLQHREGSFDEFYPFERGWVGPTAFTCFTVAEALRLLGDEVQEPVRERVTAAVARAARFIALGQSEEDHLANHHAMACLAVWKVYELTGTPDLRLGFERVWDGFLGYHVAEEGWSREYDGVDPGYLSATVSFLAKIYQTNPDPAIREVLSQSVEFCSYCAYPNGSFAGSIGSRNTQHFYPHGFEVLAHDMPMAAAVAERMLAALAEGGLVPPAMMSDRYVFYRVPELLQAYLDYAPRPEPLPSLPSERDNHRRYFPEAGLFAATHGRHYVVANLAKGGVLKVFNRETGRLLCADNGMIVRTRDGSIATSQWIDPDYARTVGEDRWSVSGHMQVIPANKLFSLAKNLVFRLVLLLFGWSPRFCHFLKGRIRGILILGRKRSPIRFTRAVRMTDGGFVIEDELRLDGGARMISIIVGEDISVRYVPQSRFFQLSELQADGLELGPERLADLGPGDVLKIRTRIGADGTKRQVVR